MKSLAFRGDGDGSDGGVDDDGDDSCKTGIAWAQNLIFKLLYRQI